MPPLDALSFSDLYDQYYSDVFRFSYWLCGHREEAKDIAAETFVRIWTVETELQAQTVKGYLLTVARNIYLQNNSKRQHTQALSEEILDDKASAEATIIAQDQVQKVILGLQQLVEPDRSILIMKAYEGLSYQEIAAIYDMPISRLKTKVHRARVKLALWIDSGEYHGH